MTTLPDGLSDLLRSPALPAAALSAAADVPTLLELIADRDDLPVEAIESGLRRGTALPTGLAARLAGRPLPASTVRHLLQVTMERRPEVLAALVRHNVPGDDDRRWLLALADPQVDEAVLSSGSWPVDEALEVVRRTGGSAALRWLARLDPAVTLTADDLVPEHLAVARLDGDPVTALMALVRRPWLAELPLELAGAGLRAALATVTPDERTQLRLLGTAERFARYGRTSQAAGLIEAVALNPTASLTVQRRCKVLARRVRCHYLQGWRPAAPTCTGPLWRATPDQQRATLDRLEQHTDARHRTVWSAGLLATAPQLTDDVRARLTAYLATHLTAVVTDPATIDLLGDVLEVPAEQRRSWHLHARHGTRPAVAGPCTSGELIDDPEQRWPLVTLAGCREPQAAANVAGQLTRHLGADTDAWTLAWLLLRDGWETPLAGLPAVVGTLQPAPAVAA